MKLLSHSRRRKHFSCRERKIVSRQKLKDIKFKFQETLNIVARRTYSIKLAKLFKTVLKLLNKDNIQSAQVKLKRNDSIKEHEGDNLSKLSNGMELSLLLV